MKTRWMADAQWATDLVQPGRRSGAPDNALQRSEVRPEGALTRCKKCQRPIYQASGTDGDYVLVDVDPVIGGSVRIEHTQLGIFATAVPPHETALLHKHHKLTCGARKHRKTEYRARKDTPNGARRGHPPKQRLSA